MNEVEYILIAKVDDETVFQSSYPDTAMLEEELYKAERAVGEAIEMELSDDED